MVEIDSKQPDYSNPGAYTQLSVRTTETDMWSRDLLGSLSDNLIYIIAGIVVVIVVVAAILVFRRRKTSVPPSAPSTVYPDTCALTAYGCNKSGKN